MAQEERSGPVHARKATKAELQSGVFVFRSGFRTTRRVPDTMNYRRETR